MIIEWQNQRWISRTITTGEWWGWAYDVSCRAARNDPEWVSYACEWCAKILSVSVEDLAEILAEVGPEKVIFLGLEIVKSSSMPSSLKDGLATFYNVTYECDDYDPAQEKGGPCECPECRGDVDYSPLCKFRQPAITDDVRLLAPVRADRIAQFWSLPLPLYQQESERLAAISRRDSVKDQRKKKSEARAEIRDQILSKNGIF